MKKLKQLLKVLSAHHHKVNVNHSKYIDSNLKRVRKQAFYDGTYYHNPHLLCDQYKEIWGDNKTVTN